MEFHRTGTLVSHVNGDRLSNPHTCAIGPGKCGLYAGSEASGQHHHGFPLPQFIPWSSQRTTDRGCAAARDGNDRMQHDPIVWRDNGRLATTIFQLFQLAHQRLDRELARGQSPGLCLPGRTGISRRLFETLGRLGQGGVEFQELTRVTRCLQSFQFACGRITPGAPS